MTKLWSAVGLVAVVVAAAVLAQTGAGRALTREMGLTRTPPAYAQLSFAQPQSLPGSLTAPDTTLSVPFEIRNSSAAGRTYQWSVTLVHGRSIQRLAMGGTRVPAGGSVTTDPTVTVSCTGGRARLDVGLASPHESIDFYLTCAAATGTPIPSGSATPTGGTT
jgi:hypothetical protein